MSQITNLRKSDKDKSTPDEKTKKNKETPPDHKEIKWRADYSRYISPTWQKGVIIILIVLIIVLSIIRYNLLTLIFLGLLLFVFILKMKTYKETASITLNNGNLIFRREIIPFKDIESFWLDYTPSGIKELSIQQKKWYMPYLKIPLEDQDPVKIREFLIDFIPEIEHEETLSDTISRKLGI